MKIKIEFLENSLLINNKILVLSDLHIGEILGFGEIIQTKEVLDRLEKIFQLIKKQNKIIKKIIILGDIKHDFGKIFEDDWKNIFIILDFLIKRVKNIIIISGNHDKSILPKLKREGIKLKKYYILNKMGFLHGDKYYRKCLELSKILFLGHLHPAITLSDKYKSEKYKCFLLGKWIKRFVYILPSFNPNSYGFELNEVDNSKNNKDDFFIIPKNKLLNFQVIIYDFLNNKTYIFRKLKELIK